MDWKFHAAEAKKYLEEADRLAAEMVNAKRIARHTPFFQYPRSRVVGCNRWPRRGGPAITSLSVPSETGRWL